ncbi:hypothetical protein [Nocardia sp. NPDC047648]|uniref:hypothetical protein n=1 Tax=Nocardia sp. NPDC047648 TaxID=3155625 RepID=UPI0033CB8C05
MNIPDETSGLPEWKARLLARLQDTTADYERMLHEGSSYPRYGRRGGEAVDAWRSAAAEVDRSRHDLEFRIRAAGIREADITAAAQAGRRGIRSDILNSRPAAPDGNSAVRVEAVDAIADDVWDLEHMAAIAVDREWRHNDRPLPTDPDAQRQYECNMAALWERAATTALAAGLSDTERTELWDRDQAGWIRLLKATVYGYDAANLEQRWREYARPGAAIDIARTTDPPAPHASQRILSGAVPPAPSVMLGRASEALNADHSAVEAAGEDVHEYRFDSYIYGPVTETVDRQAGVYGGFGLIEAAGLDNRLDRVVHQPEAGDVGLSASIEAAIHPATTLEWAPGEVPAPAAEAPDSRGPGLSL